MILGVTALATAGARRHRGLLAAGGQTIPCALGRAGVTATKREGDGATPAGHFPLRRLFWRPDRLASPPTALPRVAITPSMGWCDDPGDPAAYNRLVRLPHAAGHEVMARADGLYDLVVEIGFNDDPPVAGAGSAIFLHVAAPDLGPTEGCVAIARPALLALAAKLAPGDAIEIALP